MRRLEAHAQQALQRRVLHCLTVHGAWASAQKHADYEARLVQFVLFLVVLTCSLVDVLSQPWPQGPWLTCTLPYALSLVQYKAVAVPLWAILVYAAQYTTLEVTFGFGFASSPGADPKDLNGSIAKVKRQRAAAKHQKDEGSDNKHDKDDSDLPGSSEDDEDRDDDGEDGEKKQEDLSDSEWGGAGRARDPFVGGRVRGAGLPRSWPTFIVLGLVLALLGVWGAAAVVVLVLPMVCFAPIWLPLLLVVPRIAVGVLPQAIAVQLGAWSTAPIDMDAIAR